MTRLRLSAAVCLSALVLGLAACSDEAQEDAAAGDGATPEATEQRAVQVPAEAPDLPEVDPACLAPVLQPEDAADGERPDLPMTGCADAIEHREGWAIWTDTEAERMMRQPYITARTVAVTPSRRIAIEVSESGGGTGIFSYVITGDLSMDGQRITAPLPVAFGDRCNGGIERVETRGETVVVYTRMAAGDVLYSTAPGSGDTDRFESAKGYYGGLFDQAPYCAVCCSGVLGVTEIDLASGSWTETGLAHDPETALNGSEQEPSAACIVRAVGEMTGEDGLVPLSSFDALREKLKACNAELP